MARSVSPCRPNQGARADTTRILGEHKHEMAGFLHFFLHFALKGSESPRLPAPLHCLTLTPEPSKSRIFPSSFPATGIQ